MFVDTLLFTLEVTAPLLLWMALGFGLSGVGLLTPRWIQRGSRAMFYVFLPLLMFISMVRKPLDQALDPFLLLVGFIVTYGVYRIAVYRSADKRLPWAQATVYQQGAMRGNLGIIGVSLCLNAYGQEALLDISPLMAVLAVFYNILSTLIFVRRRPDAAQKTRRHWLLSLLSNPLIAASALGLLVNLSPARLPELWLDRGLDWIQYSFPMALLCVGGSLSLRNMAARVSLTRDIALLKLVIMPVLCVCLLLLAGYQGAMLGMMFLLTASPVATASYVMAQAYGADAEFAANTVVTTTLLSLLSLSAGVFALRLLNLM